MWGQSDKRRFDRYVPRVLLRRLATAPDEPVLTLDGTVVFVDLSGFTRLSERLASKGKEGAEHIVDTIDSCFSVLLSEAYENGGSLVKFGGDALLLWFEGEGHPLRACASAVAMRRTLRRIGRIRAGGSEVVLRMSVGVHSGAYETFLVGASHREYLIAGPAASTVVQMEAAASAGQILVSRETASLLPDRWTGAACGPGVLLARAREQPAWVPDTVTARPSDDAVAMCLSSAMRAHLLRTSAPAEHRIATAAFLQYGGLDELITGRGPAAAAAALDELICAAQEAADHYQICFLNSDIAGDGGKLLFSAGAPRAVGDDEERMLLAMRQILEAQPHLPIRIGVNRGSTFTGEVGPPCRRTYAVMGDVVNLAARLSAKAPWGAMYTTDAARSRVKGRFALTSVAPFAVKGKVRPIEAVIVGTAARSAPPGSSGTHVQLIGRDLELAVLRRSIAEAASGKGVLIELVGETGSGKSRLLAEGRELAGTMPTIHATCEVYTQSIPYVAWREPLRQLLGLGWEAPDEVVLERLQTHVLASHPQLLPWLPLLAIAMGIKAPSTQEVEELAQDVRTTKLHEVVLTFLAPALTAPTLVLIEHAQLMDEASTALLDALAGRLEHSSWVVLATRRDVDGGFTTTSPSALRMELTPLSPTETFALAEATPEAQVIPPHVLQLAVERSAGSPEFLLDLLSAAAGGSGVLPDSIEAAASMRIDALEPDDRVLTRRAAVLGLSFDPRRLGHVLEPGAEEPGEETWWRLSAIFATDPDGHIRFKRPAVCEVAYDGLPFRLRRQLHAAIGRALENDLGGGRDVEPAVLSRHFSAAGDHGRARKYALIGAGRASASFAHADAAHLYRLAIDAGRHDGASAAELAASWESLGAALHRTGELPAAAEAITAARRLTVDDPVAQGRLLYRHTLIAENSARLVTAVRWAHRGLRALENRNEPEAVVWRARTLARLAFYRVRQRRLLEAERLCHRAVAEAEPVGELEAQAYAYYMLDAALFEAGREAELGYSERALEIYRRLGDLEQEGSVLNNLSNFAAERWSWGEALQLLRRSVDCSERAGVHGQVALAESNIGEIILDRGLYEEASSHVRRARRLFNSIGDRAGTAYATALLGRLAVRSRRHGEGISLLRQAIEDLQSLGEHGYADFAESWLAEAESFGGDPRRALAISTRLIVTSERTLPLLHRARAIALARLGKAEAHDELAVSLALARQRGALFDVALALDLAETIERPDPACARERDAILARLGIEQLPAPPLALSVVREDLSAAVS